MRIGDRIVARLCVGERAGVRAGIRGIGCRSDGSDGSDGGSGSGRKSGRTTVRGRDCSSVGFRHWGLSLYSFYYYY